MAKYKAYPEYKDSGVEWLGEIPMDWQVIATKYIAQLTPKKSAIPRSKLSEVCSFVPMEKLKLNTLVLDEERIINQVYDGYTYFEDGDLLIAKVTPCFENKNMAVAEGLINRIGFGSSEIYVLRCGDQVHQKFLFYRLQEDSFMAIAIAAMSGAGGLKRVPAETVNSYLLGLPEWVEQVKIAAFLDHETAKIDNLIEKQQQLIELLKEKRQAVISHAVTKGLNPDVPMKDSGVECLRIVPQHWELSRLRYKFSFAKGLTITKENLSEEGIPCVNYGEVHSKYGFEVDPRIHPLKCVSRKYLKDNMNSLLFKGDIVFADTSEDLEGAGNFTQLISDSQVFAGYHTIIARPLKRDNRRFYAYLLDCRELRTQVRLAVKGVKVFSVTQAILRNVSIWLPPENEQQRIADFLDQKTVMIDTLINKQRYQIELLKERRTALISAAVTGKIDVRNWVAPNARKVNVEVLEEATA